MTEPRADEARQTGTPPHTPMPTIGDARHALAIHGERNDFRTVTISFATAAEATEFDARVRGDSVAYAVQVALADVNADIRVEARP